MLSGDSLSASSPDPREGVTGDILENLLQRMEQYATTLDIKVLMFSYIIQLYYREGDKGDILDNLPQRMEELGTSTPWKTNINVGNVKRFARNCQIEEPISLDLVQLLARYRECKDHTKKMIMKAPWL